MSFEKLKKALEDFNYAGQALATAMEETHYDSPEAKAMEWTANKYPFSNSFNEVSYEIHTWCEDTIEQLLHEEIEQFCKFPNYVMCLKDCAEREDEPWFEEGWFFSIKSSDNFGDVRIIEEIEGGGYNVGWDFFKENFITIPEELFKLATNANIDGDYEAICKIQDLAKIIGKMV